MIRKLGVNKILWFLDALLSLIAALIGVFNPGIYSKVISTELMPGVISQDIITIIASIAILLCIFRTKEKGAIMQIIILGIIGYLFYGYGIYVIERVYNILYFVYLAIFGLSFYSIVYGVANIRPEIKQQVKLPKIMRNVAVGFSLFIPLLFYPLWTTMLLPLIRTGQKIEFMYSIYIMDICFVLPAFIIIAIMTAKSQGLGLLLTPTLFIKGFTLLFSVALGGILKPFFNQTGGMGEIGMYLGLSVVFLALTVVYFRNLKVNGETS
jgi:hypothetical protein